MIVLDFVGFDRCGMLELCVFALPRWMLLGLFMDAVLGWWILWCSLGFREFSLFLG